MFDDKPLAVASDVESQSHYEQWCHIANIRQSILHQLIKMNGFKKCNHCLISLIMKRTDDFVISSIAMR